MLKLNTQFGTDSQLYSLSHFECNGHTVHMLTQQCLLSPLTSTVKSSLFTHTHSSPLSLAARLHRCRANSSRYIINGWSFSGQTISIYYIYLPIYEGLHVYITSAVSIPLSVDTYGVSISWLMRILRPKEGK